MSRNLNRRMRGVPAKGLCFLWMGVVIAALWISVTSTGAAPLTLAYDKSACSSARSAVSSASSAYQSASTAYDYCSRYGDTNGDGYGDRDCGGAYSDMQSAKSAYDSAVSSEWQYCY